MSSTGGSLDEHRGRDATPRPASVVEAFVQNARCVPQKLCLRFEGEDYGYGRLLERARSFAAALGNSGLAPGDRVALFLGNHPDFLAAYVGTHLAGGVVPREDFAMPEGEDLAVIAYTSGTTGRSKGAMLLHRNLVANAAAICSAWRWSADDHLLLALPLFHTHGLMVGAHGTFFTGASAELHRKFDAGRVYDALLEGRVTMFFGVPTMYVRLLREAEARVERPRPLRLYVSGSAPLSPHAFEVFERVFGERILERYGMTETIMNLTNPYEGERRPGTVGKPYPGQEARVVDIKTREPLSADEVGEIEVRGPHVFAGYWNRPDATEETFDEDGWFRTGDLGSVSEDGYFTISGRSKELIISGGYNVYPREVEEVVEGCPGVSEAAVVGLPDPEFGERVVAAVVREDPGLTAEKVTSFCREDLAGYKKPREVVFVEDLPRNALGKVLKHRVRERLSEPEE